jgi:hypothetical protein
MASEKKSDWCVSIAGILQIVYGMLVAIVSVAMIFFQSALYFFGYGVWTGLFFLTAGSLAVSSAKSKNMCPIVGCLVMSIFSMMAAAIVVAFGAIGLGIDSEQCGVYDYTDDEWCEERKTTKKINIALQGVNLLTGLFEWIVALVQMIICSRALCCAPSSPGAVYYSAAPQQVQVQGQYPQSQQPTYSQYHPQQYGPYPHGPYAQQAYPAGYPDQRLMQQYPGVSQYQPAPQQSAPPLYPQLPPHQYDESGRPPPYNPGPAAQGPSAPAPAYSDVHNYPLKQAVP